MSHFYPFRSGGTKLRAATKNGETFFVLSDVCKALGVAATAELMQPLKEYEKLTVVVSPSGIDSEIYTISESGLYRLIGLSDSPKAETFRSWIAVSVIPAMRRVAYAEIAEKSDEPDIVGLMRDMLGLYKGILKIVQPPPKRKTTKRKVVAKKGATT